MSCNSGRAPGSLPRRACTPTRRPQQAPPLPQQQGASLPLVRDREGGARRVRRHPMSFRGFASRRKGAAGGGNGRRWRWSGREEGSPEGEAGRRSGPRREKQRCGFVWVLQRLLPPFVAAGCLARWLFWWSSSSNFILSRSFRATCSFSQGTKPCHAFKYLIKCFRGSGQLKQHLGYFPLATYLFFIFSCVFIPILKYPVFTCRTV